jgi:hypothetical protein
MSPKQSRKTWKQPKLTMSRILNNINDRAPETKFDQPARNKCTSMSSNIGFTIGGNGRTGDTPTGAGGTKPNEPNPPFFNELDNDLENPGIQQIHVNTFKVVDGTGDA